MIDDCSTIELTGAAGECKLINEQYGHDCAVSGTGACAKIDGNDFESELCAATSGGCITTISGDTLGSACTAELGTCTDPGEDQQFTAYCVNNFVIDWCVYGQPQGWDCETGTCEGGKCKESAGGPCDPTHTFPYECNAGLTCNQQTWLCEQPQ